ncbi:transmembrane signal receptor [Lithospermum erythrorhizon]|uniref:Transmembrane signal receptor n=1 Tax=Lithospermum erythrorhizon TaxID=34254 RepID=A0AAV3NKL6_LITER
MLVYVDDILVTGNQSFVVTTFIAALSARFVTRDLGDLSFFLGIEAIKQSDESLLISQRQHMVDLLTKANMLNSKPVRTDMSTTSAELPSCDASPDPTLYRQLVGSLQYLTLTRPDLSFAVNKVCQHMHDPQASHFLLVKHILRYVKGTLDMGLLIAPSRDIDIQAFSDADWAGSAIDRCSTGGYTVYLGPNLISWQSKKQRTVARSSTEFEYKALADCSAELSWLVSLLRELHLSPSKPPILWCDNLGATYLSANPVFHAHTKHIEIDFHFVLEKVARKELQIQFISTKDQIVDVLTKPLATSRFIFFRDKLRLRSRPPSACAVSIE